MDMRSLLTLLEVIERVCTPEKGKQEEKAQKASFNGKKGKKRPPVLIGPCPKESPFCKMLQPWQETWGRTHDP